jgi:hypothetical protein
VRDAIEAAEGQFEVNAVQTIQKAAAGDWKAAAWLLERRHADRWSLTTRLRVGGDADAPPVQVQQKLDEVRAAEILNILVDTGAFDAATAKARQAQEETPAKPADGHLATPAPARPKPLAVVPTGVDLGEYNLR